MLTPILKKQLTKHKRTLLGLLLIVVLLAILGVLNWNDGAYPFSALHKKSKLENIYSFDRLPTQADLQPSLPVIESNKPSNSTTKLKQDTSTSLVSADPAPLYKLWLQTNRCRDIIALGADRAKQNFLAELSGSPLREVRIEAYEKLKADCAKRAATVSKDDPYKLLKEAKEMNEAPAIALELQRRILEGDRNDEIRPLIEALIQKAANTDAGLLLERLGFLFSSLHDISVTGATIASQDMPAFQAAWTFLACERGLDCGVEATNTLDLCAYRSICNSTSLVESYQQGLLTPQEYEKALHYTAQLRAIFIAKNFEQIKFGLEPAKFSLTR